MREIKTLHTQVGVSSPEESLWRLFTGLTKRRFVLLFFIPSLLFAQVPSDTSRAIVSADTLARPPDVDTLIVYSAKDSIVYSMRSRTMNLHGNGDLKYRDLGLQAARINVRWDTADLTAHGVKDTADTTGKAYMGLPQLIDAGEKYDGFRVGYNFRSKKGKISLADTEIEQGYYHGEEIKKVDTDVLFVADGRYTTCSLDHPHYYFFSPKMKVIVRDKVVAEPIYLYIADIPVFWLPFGVFPNKAGRRSGIIAPAYGQDARRGHYLSHFGYYWAISDYFDFTTTFDWFARGGWLNRSSFRYAKRYDFSGSVNASVTRTHEGEPGDPDRVEQRDYHVSIHHDQNIDPTSRLFVDFTFSSGSYFRNFSPSQSDILRQNIVSNATYTKTWEGNRSLSLNIYRDQNLQTGAVNERLPSLSFQQGQFYPFRRSSKSRGLAGQSTEYSWYEMIGVSYNAQAQNNRAKTFDVVKSVVNPAEDSIRTERRNDRLGAEHRVAVNIAPKLGYVTISPSLSYRELWYAERIERDSTGTREVNGFQAVRTYSTALSASTRFYGIMQPQLLGITGIRHTVTPSLSFNFQPDFSDPSYGYYGTYVDTLGRTVKYNKYERGIFGGATAGRQQSLSFSVGNIFEMKYQPADTAKKEEKIQLLNANAGFAYNFAADSLRLSTLNVSYRTAIGRYLDISASTVYNFYVFDEAVGARVNRFNIDEKGYLADLTSFSLSVSTTLSGDKKSAPAPQTPQSVQQEQQAASGLPPQPSGYSGIYGDETPDFSIPWSLTLAYNFSQSQNDPRRVFRSSSVNANLSFSLTENWRFSASGSYDFVQKRFASPYIRIYRDLHCWEMNFSWYPIGFYRGYRLELRVKAPQLHDLKIEKQGSARGTYY